MAIDVRVVSIDSSLLEALDKLMWTEKILCVKLLRGATNLTLYDCTSFMKFRRGEWDSQYMSFGITYVTNNVIITIAQEVKNDSNN